MPIFYTGPRPVLKGRSSNDNIHPWNGRSEKYSNYSIFNTSHVLDGAPNNNHVPGEGRHPHGLKSSRLFQGLENAEQPLKAPGGGARLEGFRYRPLENKAAGNNLVFKANYGHAPGTPVLGQEQYGVTDWTFNGVTTKSLSGSFGHSTRGIGATGTANSFGRFDPNNPAANAVVAGPLVSAGNTRTYNINDNTTAHKKVNEWLGVPSAQAL